MFTLTADECRVLGVMIEKAQTTPAQYPLSLNGLTVGCNQKNNRDPVTELSEERVFDAVDSLRHKGLVREMMLSGSRVSKFKHETREKLALTLQEMVILAELWLRGPQSVGELRGRASRMHDLGSIEDVQRTLQALMQPREVVAGPMVKQLLPSPGERANRYVQLLCPDLHPVDHVSRSDTEAHTPASPREAAPAATQLLEARIARLEHEMGELRAAVERLSR